MNNTILAALSTTRSSQASPLPVRITVLGATLAALSVLSAATAMAQADPAQHTEAATLEMPEANATNLVLTAGGVLQTGNTEALLVNSGALFELVRGRHAFTANLTWVLGLGEGFQFSEPTAHNINGRARYDIFFTDDDAAFGAFVTRWDRFAGLAPRLQGQVGYLRNLIRETDEEGKIQHRFWGEVGYDLTGDFFDYDIIDEETGPPDPDNRPDTETIHSLRLFLGYQKVVNENLALRGFVEGLINVEDPGDSRINGEAAATVAIADNLQAELLFRVQVDTDPPGDGDNEAESVDTTTQLNLVYTLL